MAIHWGGRQGYAASHLMLTLAMSALLSVVNTTSLVASQIFVEARTEETAALDVGTFYIMDDGGAETQDRNGVPSRQAALTVCEQAVRGWTFVLWHDGFLGRVLISGKLLTGRTITVDTGASNDIGNVKTMSQDKEGRFPAKTTNGSLFVYPLFEHAGVSVFNLLT